MKKNKRPRYSDEELELACRDSKQNEGLIEYKGRKYYKAPFEKAMAIIKQESKKDA